jgi:hypothetical protein
MDRVDENWTFRRGCVQGNGMRLGTQARLTAEGPDERKICTVAVAHLHAI